MLGEHISRSLKIKNQQNLLIDMEFDLKPRQYMLGF